MKLPNNVVENNLSDMPPPDKYAGLVYRWTNLVNLGIYEKTGEEVPIYYDGSHGSDKELTAYVGDGYWHSSQNKEFGKVFSDSSSKLRYEILEYFDLQYDMKMKENFEDYFGGSNAPEGDERLSLPPSRTKSKTQVLSGMLDCSYQ